MKEKQGNLEVWL